MATIFTNAKTQAETLSAQGAIVTWGTGGTTSGATPLVMTGLELTFQRPLTTVYPINREQSTQVRKVYKFAGDPKGTLNVQAILCANISDLRNFVEAASKECKATSDQVTMIIEPFGGACQNSSASSFNTKFVLENVELEQLGLAIQGQQAGIVAFPTAFTFTGLDWQ